MPHQQVSRVLIMAGGTGGHVVPALSLAKALRERGVVVEWLGSPRGIENQLVPAADITLHRVQVSGLRGNGIAGWLWAPWRLAKAIWQARQVIATFDPQLVVGLGGFASGPGGLAAWLMRRRLIIHEQNAVAGMTNRYLSRLADRVYAAFPGAFGERHADVVGNPVRDDIATLGETPRDVETLRARPLRLLVLGGSLGAQALNSHVPQALARLPAAQRPDVRHQAGRDKETTTQAEYAEMEVSAEVSAFIDDMAAAYDWADLIVCRAGALTIAELAAAAKPSVLVPFPHAVDDHQTLNARQLVDAGAARLMPQEQLSAVSLAETLAALLEPETLATMAVAARSEARLEAIERLVAGCMEANVDSE
ncbi:undecaprenyldiphospho-muramoylpentapeptide beta-N-acetylglucosaminyltransferase [Chromohalobacter sp. TMW 2.2308]|uniref:UDP-N-acetylglucosamine--N-acetylmuramyl-(pentapeptide) pyrophosphoryl-undecaprenol N-acetylglucosamine transferase n=2 Tax=Halomonadaceae TaxID=28256 RepID=A0A9X2X3P6_9GAMM|nr:undecaprenyldiphospho-muramoylpentapeptide beta-N-acetylglucosaminyltransferase [Chromohalobacter moromii]MCK2046542.1 undecaprenyldiphospho-muramoylpentapeptide beta-N-acetylglucosaminyltransferase [Chromohalobacter moromii]MCT8506048.1 undecaprenyldiphospho-muramoylpentapeptide beta-N-acetylglucosaminyltransferase [Chromohalobacter moromii]MCT8516101.1 undecaprenyldiphospho-muramoylpentapeptide beta-N-acetylglucosaminyltransferase [Chromohalobacter sp. TMW 2.2271]